MQNEETKIASLEKEVAKLKIHIRILADYLTTADSLPILGPNQWENYEKAVKRELDAVDQRDDSF